MKAALWYRIAAGLLVLFAILHTIGFLSFKPPTAEGARAWDAMNNVHFGIDGKELSYAGFYRAFGIFLTAYLLFAAVVAWQLATHPMPAVGWALCAVQLAGIVLSVLYIAAPQIAFSAVLAVCVGFATLRSQAETRS